MERYGYIKAVVLILAIGLLIAFASTTSSSLVSLRPIMLVGCCIIGLLRLGRTPTTHPRELASPAEQQPLVLGADTAPRIAGEPCTHCGSKIESRLDGTACKTCERPLHHDCRASHGQRCGKRGAAYRS